MGKQNTSGETVGTPAWQKWESNASQSTALETWQTAITRTGDPVIAAVYKMSWYFELRVVPVGPLNSRGEGRFSIDGTVKGNVVEPGEEWCAFSGWDYVNTLSAGDEPVLAVEWRRDHVLGGNDNIEIRKVKMALEQMG